MDHAHGLWVTEMGFHQYHSQIAYEPEEMRARPVWTYLFMASGTGYLRLGGYRGRLETGQSLVLPPWRIHGYGSRKPWSSVFIHFGGGQASRLAGRVTRSSWPVVTEPDAQATWGILRGMILECRRRRQATQPVLAVGLTRLLNEFRERCRSVAVPGGMGGSPGLSAMQDWMKANLHRNITVAQMADRAGLSSSYFSRFWRRHTGSAPMDYLIDLRLLRARSMLSRTSMPVRAIAQRSGFADQLYFSRLFRKRIGLPPSIYRENTRGR